MARNRERPRSATALPWFENSKRVRESEGEGCRIADGSWATVQDNHFAVPRNRECEV
jgi:hypothetical protein